MTDDIIRKATTADYIETIDNLRAEVGRLRSIEAQQLIALESTASIVEHQAARIKELEEANRNIDKRRDEMAAFIERLEAAFLESEAAMLFYRGTRYPVWPDIGAHAEVYRQQAREALERIKAGGKDD